MSWTNLVPIATRCYKYYKYVWLPNRIFFDSPGIASLLVQPGHCLELADPKSQSRTSPSVKSTFCRQMSTGQASNDHSESEIWWNYVELVGQSSFIKNRALPPMNCSTKSIFKCCSCNCWSHHFNIFYQYQFRRCVSAGVQTKIPFPEYCFSYLRLGWWWACVQAISPMGRSCFVWRLWIKDTPTSMDRKSSCMWPSDQPHLGFQVVVSLGQVTKRQVKLQLSIASSNESYQSHRSSRHLPPGNLT